MAGSLLKEKLLRRWQATSCQNIHNGGLFIRVKGEQDIVCTCKSRWATVAFILCSIDGNFYTLIMLSCTFCFDYPISASLCLYTVLSLSILRPVLNIYSLWFHFSNSLPASFVVVRYPNPESTIFICFFLLLI